MTINGFQNTIFEGTRLCPSTGKQTLLDVILCMFMTLFFTASNTFFYPESDHKLVISIFNFKTARIKSTPFKSRCLNLPTLEKIKVKMKLYFKDTNLSLIKDSNEYWLQIKAGILYSRDNIAKLKSFNVKPINNTPWFGKPLVKIARLRDKIYFRAIK